MPELPEVQTIAAGLQQMFKDNHIRNVHCRRSKLRYSLQPKLLKKILEGARVQQIKRRGKYMIWQLNNTAALIVHLGMSGRFRKVSQNHILAKHEHVILSLANGYQIRYEDPRRFGFFIPIANGQWQEHPCIKKLGVEPLPRLSPTYMLQHAKKREIPIKQFIMDQKIVVGIGNIYANEALFLSKIHPLSPAKNLTRYRWQKLSKAITDVLSKAIEAGGTTLKDNSFSDVQGDHGQFQVELNIYDREHQNCVYCNNIIRSKVIGGRSSFFCPSCQSVVK